MEKMFFVRGGYKLNVEEQNYTFGAGLKVPISIAEFTFDYAYSNFCQVRISSQVFNYTRFIK